MKIFNWVHNRLHQSVLKDGFSKTVDRAAELGTKDQGTQAFLKEVGLVNVEGLDGWSTDGILTIGTFGFDPLLPFNPQNEYLVLESEEEEERNEEHYGDNVEDEELNPLMLTTFGHSFDQDIGSESDAMVVKPAGDDRVILTIDGVPLTPFEGSNEITSCAEPADQRNKRGQRVTLADLFQADVHGHVGQLKLDSCSVQQQEVMQKKMKVGTKSGGLAFAKKLIPRGKQDSSPIKNLQKLMRRMLKRKIHPAEVVHKSDSQKKPSAVEIATDIENCASESVSLLPMQGAICVR